MSGMSDERRRVQSLAACRVPRPYPVSAVTQTSKHRRICASLLLSLAPRVPPMPPPPVLPALTLALAMTVAIPAAVGTRSSSPSSPQPIVVAVHDAIKARGKGGGPDAAPSS
eukprot:COSAG01_NODE_43260_length_431_cov_2.319277_1_plen_111_part_10